MAKWAKAATSDEELVKLEQTVAFFRTYGAATVWTTSWRWSKLPGIAAQAGRQESGRGDRRDAGDARHREGSGRGGHHGTRAQYKYYLAYQMIAEQRAEREKARKAVKEGAGK